tara:strand:+ start:371 stop:568 length:198 start_codon:yes stop_codon:yes gene_type:complete
MAEEQKIDTGDVVCLKSEQNETGAKKHKLTVGARGNAHGTVYVHWFYQGELKSEIIAEKALHKIK